MSLVFELEADLVVLCDFDGTITGIDTVVFILTKFAQGDWKVFDKQYENGEINLEECLRKQFSLVRASERQILDELENSVFLRPNFGELVEYCKRNSIPLMIVSAGLDFVIKHFLDLNGWQHSVATYTPKTKFSTTGIEFIFPRLFDEKASNFKEDLVRHYKVQGKRVVYIGDGVADYPAAKNADFPFAIKGSRLAKICEGVGLSCENITDFKEIVEAVQRMVGARPASSTERI
jgi:2,3-diketo-5-methylthio-1-phosphopentane phosphatase